VKKNFTFEPGLTSILLEGQKGRADAWAKRKNSDFLRRKKSRSLSLSQPKTKQPIPVDTLPITMAKDELSCEACGEVLFWLLLCSFRPFSPLIDDRDEEHTCVVTRSRCTGYMASRTMPLPGDHHAFHHFDLLHPSLHPCVVFWSRNKQYHDNNTRMQHKILVRIDPVPASCITMRAAFISIREALLRKYSCGFLFGRLEYDLRMRSKKFKQTKKVQSNNHVCVCVCVCGSLPPSCRLTKLCMVPQKKDVMKLCLGCRGVYYVSVDIKDI
jgi:hypothetical protein